MLKSELQGKAVHNNKVEIKNRTTKMSQGKKFAGKEKALANALLTMSEKNEIQDMYNADDIVYCGKEEPIYGWTNTVPNAR